MEFVLERYNYWIIIVLMMGGLYIVFESQNLIKRLAGLSIFQTSVIVFYVTLGKVAGGTAPIFIGDMHGGHGDDHGGEHHADDKAHGAAAAHETTDAHAEGDHGHGEAIVDAHGDEHATDAAHAVEAAKDAGHATDTAHVASDLHATGGHEVVDAVIYSNPLPHVLMLTAIVVGVATLSVGLALVVRIREAYGTIEMDEVRDADIAEGEAEGGAA